MFYCVDTLHLWCHFLPFLSWWVFELFTFYWAIQAAITKIPQEGWFKQQRLLPPSFGAWNSEMKGLADSVSGGSLLPPSQMVFFFLCPHTAEGARELSRVSHKATNPTYNSSTLMNYLLKFRDLEYYSQSLPNLVLSGPSHKSPVTFHGVPLLHPQCLQTHWGLCLECCSSTSQLLLTAFNSGYFCESFLCGLLSHFRFSSSVSPSSPVFESPLLSLPHSAEAGTAGAQHQVWLIFVSLPPPHQSTVSRGKRGGQEMEAWKGLTSEFSPQTHFWEKMQKI